MFKLNLMICLVLPILTLNTKVLAESLCYDHNNRMPASTAHLAENGEGTVSDDKSGLVWKKCSEGQSWNSVTNSCDGSAGSFNWQEALYRAEDVNQGHMGENLGKNDWRVPNVKELASIVEQSCRNTKINALVFPSTPQGKYWSSTPDIDSNDRAWDVLFKYGDDMRGDYKNNTNHVRLVRSAS